jgi:hypothetical protein
MRFNAITRLLTVTVATIATSAMLSVSANAQTATVGSGTTTGTAVAGFKYKIDNTNWDMALHNGTGTGSAGTFKQAALGNRAQLDNRNLGFEIDYNTSTGFLFKITGAPTGTQTLSYNFTETLGGSQLSSFDSLQLELRALTGAAVPVGSFIELTNLTFTGLSTTGSFSSPFIATATGSNGTDVKVYNKIDGIQLSDYNWKLSGNVKADLNGGTASPGEAIRFEVLAKQSAPIPEPGALALALPAALSLGAMVRRRRK